MQVSVASFYPLLFNFVNYIKNILQFCHHAKNETIFCQDTTSQNLEEGMKALYKEILKFTKNSGDLVRKPCKDSDLVLSFAKEYGISIEETNIFFFIFSFSINTESFVCASDIKRELKLSFDEYISFMGIVESLRSKDMIVYGDRDLSSMNLNPTLGIDDSLIQKLVFGKNPLDNFKLDNPYSIIEYVTNLTKQRKDGELSTKKLYKEIDNMLLKIDKKLSAFHLIRSYDDQERATLFIVANEYLSGNSHLLRAQDVAEHIEEKLSDRMMLFTKMLNGELKILKDNYIELDDDVFFENPMIKLTKVGAKKLFDMKNRKKDKKIHTELSSYIKHKTLKTNLYFPKTFETEILRLKKALEPKKFEKLLKELKKNNHSKGFISLFYGAPGTGKTALAYEIANVTKRDILQVDIEKIRDKYVGESEKRIARIFTEYKEAKKLLKREPILLFNEADALLGQRIGVSSSIDQMNNSMQNILLQNLENFKGIFIATTNLIDNIDDAFSRRFLYKLEFPKPLMDAREKIWQTRLPNLEKNVYHYISKYELSGGQIELIAKQFLIRSFLEEENNPQLILERMIKNELSYKTSGSKNIGFSLLAE